MKKCLIVMGYMSYGGVQKSLINFLEVIKDKADIEVLLWGRTKNEIPLPQWVKIINIPTVKSVRATLRENGLISRSFVLSCLGVMRNKRWKAMPRMKKHYDIAIAYSQVGFPKYYVIDRVDAKKKYAFYHHGAYEFSNTIKEWDKEYYPKYDKVFAVSEHIKELLKKELSADIKFDVIPNYIDIDKVSKLGEESCEEMLNAKGFKILTVGRLSVEKNIIKCIEVAKELHALGLDFIWFIAGDGDQKELIVQKIKEYGLTTRVVLLGNVLNPYKYMKNCDLYAQFSVYEADPITLKEVLVFNKRMVLSDIEAFNYYKNLYRNISICEEDVKRTAELIIEKVSSEIEENTLDSLNKKFKEKINDIIG